jgi:hypothetical protein
MAATRHVRIPGLISGKRHCIIAALVGSGSA